jgi:predicted DNA-binding protein
MYFDAVDTKIADKRLEELAQGEEQVVSAQEVWKDLGL